MVRDEFKHDYSLEYYEILFNEQFEAKEVLNVPLHKSNKDIFLNPQVVHPKLCEMVLNYLFMDLRTEVILLLILVN